MQQLLQGLTALSGLKDRLEMDLTLVKLIGQHSLWHVNTVRLLRIVGSPDDQHWLTLGQFDNQRSVPERDEFWFDTSSLPRREDFALREAAVVSASVVHTGQGPYTTVFPIDTQPDICSVLEVDADQPISPDNVALLNSVLQIYRKLQGLLDYGERDTLTELLNRKTFDSAFLRAAQVQNSNPPPNQPERRTTHALGGYWLAMIDIDHFKHVNDNFGHLIGDEVLLLLARQIRANFRFNDQLYRFGGEEFVVLMRCTNQAAACAALERFRSRIEAYPFPQVGHITVSVGFAPLRTNDTPGGAFDRADKAVYYAKSHGRNQVCSFTALVSAGELTEPKEDNPEADLF